MNWIEKDCVKQKNKNQRNILGINPHCGVGKFITWPFLSFFITVLHRKCDRMFYSIFLCLVHDC